MSGSEMAHLELYYVDPGQVGSDRLRLRGGEYHHAVRVRRCRVGDHLTVVDGEGHFYAGPVVRLDQDELIVRIEERCEKFGEPRLCITLGLSLLKGAHGEWVVDKGTELGVSIFQPVVAQRCVGRSSLRTDRWRDKALAAMKQSGRSCWPVVEPVRSLQQVLTAAAGRLVLMAHDEDVASAEVIGRRLAASTSVILLIGPEGGFTAEEVMAAREAGALILGLGARRLRSETAALTAVSKVMMLAGDLE